MNKAWIVLIALALLMAACLPGQSPEQVQAQIETAVAGTVAAQRQIEIFVAETVAAQNALTPTETPPFLATITPFNFPTLTPFATFTPVPVNPPSGGGGGGGSYVADYSCDIIRARPFDNSEIGHGQEFDIKWTILNTGSKTWPAGYDVKYLSGPLMTSVTAVEIPVQMKPKDQYQIVLDATAPEKKGFQVMTWVVQGQICYPYVAINVK